MRHGWVALICLALSACATPQIAPQQPAILLHDEAFQPRAVPARPDVFAVSASMRQYLEVEISGQLRSKGKLRGLVAALESNAQLKLEYDASVTRSAADTFEARAGNCLSLTIMTAALARELGLRVSFRRVLVDETWIRKDNTLFLGGHVNIVLTPSAADQLGSLNPAAGVIVDFLPNEELRRQRSREIHENTVIAMFMNNRAAETMAGGLLDEAYWWARGATTHDPRFLDIVPEPWWGGPTAVMMTLFPSVILQQQVNSVSTRHIQPDGHGSCRYDLRERAAGCVVVHWTVSFPSRCAPGSGRASTVAARPETELRAP